jgi:hypothetical protein
MLGSRESPGWLAFPRRLKPALLCLAVLAAPASAGTRPHVALRDGDVVLQTSRSAQSDGIQRATRSPWSHVGVIEVGPDGPRVIEAIGRVSRTPWHAFRRRGEGDVLVLRPRALDPSRARRVVAEAARFLGRPYDARFGWSDARIYCSELVAKAYERGAGVELGRRERLGDLHLSGLEDAIRARWGTVPRDLELVTPASIAADEDLVEVYRGP